MRDTLLGAFTGAAGNLGIGGRLSVGAGFGAGAANSLGGDLINDHKVTGEDVGWAVLGGTQGAGGERDEDRYVERKPPGQPDGG